MIEARNLEKGFGEKAVLRCINVTFEPGKANLVIGKSGSGKTVLLKILAGLIEPGKISNKRRVCSFRREPCSIL